MKEYHARFDGKLDEVTNAMKLQRNGIYKIVIQDKKISPTGDSKVFVWLGDMYHPISYKENTWQEAWTIIE